MDNKHLNLSGEVSVVVMPTLPLALAERKFKGTPSWESLKRRAIYGENARPCCHVEAAPDGLSADGGAFQWQLDPLACRECKGRDQSLSRVAAALEADGG